MKQLYKQVSGKKYMNLCTNLKSLLFISLYISTLFSYKSITGEEHKLIKQYTVKDVLISIGVQRMVKGITGYYWIATAEELSRYDGNKFLNFYYDDRDTNSISHNWVF